jgi:hypothetical protein
MMELPVQSAASSVLIVAAAGATGLLLIWRVRLSDASSRMWTIGMVLASAGIVLVRIPSVPVTVGDWAALAGMSVAAVALSFTLAARYAKLSRDWVQTGVQTTGFFILTSAMAGALTSDALPALRPLAAVIAVMAHLLYAAHLHATLVAPRVKSVFVAYWMALQAACWLAASAVGLFGAWTATEDSSGAATGLIAFGIMAGVLGAFNDISAEMRGSTERTTGLTAFWLVSAGIFWLGLLAFGTNIVIWVGALSSPSAQAAAIALQTLSVWGWLLISGGLAVYLLAFILRRPAFSQPDR